MTRTIADAVTHFAIDPARIVLGGYSSGGDLSYRYASHHSATVEAGLVANSAPSHRRRASRAADPRRQRVPGDEH